MDYLQYLNIAPKLEKKNIVYSFKPCYKWITFNTLNTCKNRHLLKRFKPCYKWITFNTYDIEFSDNTFREVLNLVINGLPSILKKK